MKILLTDDVVGLGDIGETVKVKPGYARNYLIPRGLAVESSTKSAKVVAHKMRQITAKKRRLQQEAEKEAATLNGVKIELPVRVGSGGKVFGSVNARQIVEALAEQGIEVDRRRVLLSEPIKKLGKREVRVKLHADVVATITLNVVPTGATAEEEAAETMMAKYAMEQAAAQRAEAEGDDESTSDEDLADEDLTDEE